MLEVTRGLRNFQTALLDVLILPANFFPAVAKCVLNFSTISFPSKISRSSTLNLSILWLVELLEFFAVNALLITCHVLRGSLSHCENCIS